MEINTSIVESYLRSDQVYYQANHWIYSRVLDGQVLFEDIEPGEAPALKECLRIFLEELDNFTQSTLEYGRPSMVSLPGQISQ